MKTKDTLKLISGIIIGIIAFAVMIVINQETHSSAGAILALPPAIVLVKLIYEL